VTTLHIDAERDGGSKVEAAEDEFKDHAGEEGGIEQGEGSKRQARVVGKKAEKERKNEGDDCGLWTCKEEQKGDATDDCRMDTPGAPKEAKAGEESTEGCGEHGFHAIELIALKERGGEERNGDQGKDEQRAAEPLAMRIGGDCPCHCDDGSEGEEPGAEGEFGPGIGGEIAQDEGAEAPKEGGGAVGVLCVGVPGEAEAVAEVAGIAEEHVGVVEA
jgi:hypothetical protein